MKKTLLLGLLLLFCGKLLAVNGIFTPTIDYSFLEHWNKTLDKNNFSIPQAETVYHQQNIAMAIFANEFSLDKKRNANIVYALKITRPDGSTCFSKDEVILFKGTAGKNKILAVREPLIFSFPVDEKEGVYNISVTLTDMLDKSQRVFSSKIQLKSLPVYSPKNIATDSAFSSFLTFYYLNPKPAEVLPYYVYFIKSKLVEKKALFTPLLTSFVEILKQNKYLFPQVQSCFNSLEIKYQLYMLYLIQYSDIAPTSFYSGLNEVHKALLTQIRKNKQIDPYAKITQPDQLDMLWSIFTSNGSYAPIRKLIQTLDLARFKGEAEKYKLPSNKDTVGTRALNDVFYQGVVWSLKSNVRQHPRVREYCEWALREEKLNSIQKSELKEIIKAK
jgi:hypothetical protein